MSSASVTYWPARSGSMNDELSERSFQTGLLAGYAHLLYEETLGLGLSSHDPYDEAPSITGTAHFIRHHAREAAALHQLPALAAAAGHSRTWWC